MSIYKRGDHGTSRTITEEGKELGGPNCFFFLYSVPVGFLLTQWAFRHGLSYAILLILRV